MSKGNPRYSEHEILPISVDSMKKNAGSRSRNKDMDGANAASLRTDTGKSIVEHLLLIGDSMNNVNEEKECPMIILDPTSDTWKLQLFGAMLYNLEFQTKQLLIPCGNLFENALRILNGANVCGPLGIISADGSLKIWNLHVSYSDVELPYLLKNCIS